MTSLPQHLSSSSEQLSSTNSTPSAHLPTSGSNLAAQGHHSTPTVAANPSRTPYAFEPSNMSTVVGGAQHTHNPSDSLNGRNPTVPAIPSINGNTSGSADHSRKPSMTVTPTGTTGFAANGGAFGGNQNKSNIQFGSVNAANSSPAMGTPPLAHQSSSSLGVNPLNPRMASPSSSPSPIPQPNQASGGTPGQGNGLVFGVQGAQGQGPHDPSDPSGLSRPLTHLQFGQQEHMRRGSSQSIHSEAGNTSLPTGPNNRGGFPMHGGRGQGNSYSYGGPQQGQMQYSPSPHQSYNRGGPNGRNMRTNYPPTGRGGPQMQYQNSPVAGTRSPAMMNVAPGTPQMNQMHMAQHMQGQGPNGYYIPHQVKPQALSSQETPRGKPGKTRVRGTARGRGRGAAKSAHKDSRSSRDPASNHFRPELVPTNLFPFPDLSPESGNFEHFLTHRAQGIPTAPDPSIQQMYQQHMQYPQMMGPYPGYMPPQSPRPPFQQNYGQPMQPTYSNQGQPPSMSRQSSQMSSAPERPGSSIGQQPHTPSVSTPSAAPHANARTPSVSGPKSNFNVPAKKSKAIEIKNAAGEIVNFNKPPASPANAPPTTATPATTITPSAPTPPSRTESAADTSHTRSDSLSAKTAEEKKKALHEAVKLQIAAEQAKLKKVESHTEEKADIDEEARDMAALKAEEAKAAAEALEQEASEATARKESHSEATPAEEPPREDAEEKDKSAAIDEIDFDAVEAELAAAEAEEARIEEEYQKKRAAEKEAQRKKEQEEAAAYEANMKELERKAEEAEQVREKEREAGSGDESARRMFAELKGSASGAATPGSTDTPALATPGESGTATPVSEASMPPPAKGMGPKRPKAADLTLDTKKPIEPPEPSATLKALQSARKVEDLSDVTYPTEITAPDTTLNQNASAGRGFKYDKAFLLQFQTVFKEKPSLDWDTKIREALGDGESSARPSASARTPSGMGGRSMSNRPPPAANAFGPMGAFGGPPRQLPPGSTSEQRFAASNAAMRGAPMGQNPFAFGRGTMGSQPMARNPSSNALGPIPGSPRVGGSRGGSRAESKRSKHSTKHTVEENKSMPLTAGMQFTALETSTTGWKPRSLGQPSLGPTPGGETLMDPETVQRKVKAALNKMTPEKFDKIADQILEIAAQSKQEPDGRTLRQVIQLTFEKATDEAHWAPMYAMFCRKMLESMSPDIRDENIKDRNGDVVVGGNLFRKYLLNRCQEEFERGWKVNLPGKPEGATEEAVMLSEEYYIAAAAKRRGLGLVKFIGELFKLGMLTERIMHECVKKLVDYDGTPDEAEVESLTSLLRTIGRQLDDPNSKAQGRMDVYFDRINTTILLPDLPSRLKFMLMDIVDLRRKGWQSKDDNKGPKTIAEIRAEAEAKARQDELLRLQQQSQRGGRGGPMGAGRGDARSFSNYGNLPPPDNSGRVGADDLRRLSARPQRNASSNSPGQLGPSLLGGRTNSGRRGLGPAALAPRGDDSGASSRTGTPPASKDKKDESSTNAFSALASLDQTEGQHSNPASPPSQSSQPNIERARSRSPATTNQ